MVQYHTYEAVKNETMALEKKESVEEGEKYETVNSSSLSFLSVPSSHTLFVRQSFNNQRDFDEYRTVLEEVRGKREEEGGEEVISKEKKQFTRSFPPSRHLLPLPHGKHILCFSSSSVIRRKKRGKEDDRGGERRERRDRHR